MRTAFLIMLVRFGFLISYFDHFINILADNAHNLNISTNY
ncbi:hypothetical protein RV07_GL002573 [Enterococcus malodoratus]|nr:hypothetical protein RV07_GL002573 [Enterococcus malodoratus]